MAIVECVQESRNRRWGVASVTMTVDPTVSGDAADLSGVMGITPGVSAVLLSRQFTAVTIRQLRHAVSTALTAQVIPVETIERFVLADHEMVTNAVRHGGGS